MSIVGIDHLTDAELEQELRRGGRFVVFYYCISVVILTFKQPSSIYFIPAGASGVSKGIGFTLLSFFLGWWGIPWGPIHTISSIATNFGGGQDVTAEVLDSMR